MDGPPCPEVGSCGTTKVWEMAISVIKVRMVEFPNFFLLGGASNRGRRRVSLGGGNSHIFWDLHPENWGR